MTLGPIEIVVIGFESGTFKGEIVQELGTLVDAGTISIVDGLFVRRTAEDELDYLELDQVGDDSEVSRLAALADRIDGLVSAEDVDELAGELPVGGAAAILVFEHTWVKPLRDAVFAAGGELAESIRVPGPVVSEVLAEIEALENEEN
ncbi:DUF6325 family protein [Demequina sp. NBRC 110055]|uniref:DUF6325 family protein n=1 Tax=Demequina sp. NBRC 110055 TaxID=1570344 RepID=UPI0009FC7C8E|nr:DUF6325 family protein [Demequina sp. NBRC 110055]